LRSASAASAKAAESSVRTACRKAAQHASILVFQHRVVGAEQNLHAMNQTEGLIPVTLLHHRLTLDCKPG
jgi:hypothetical protein